MSSDSPSKDPGQPSLWKSMVNKLLGPDQNAPLKPIDDPLDMEGLDLDLLPPEPTVKPQPSPAAAKSPAIDAVTFGDDDEAASPAPSVEDPQEEPAEVFFSDEEDAIDEDLAPAVQAEEPAPGRDDDYWDALKELDVADDAGEASPKAAGRGGSRGGRGSRERSGGRGSSRGDRGGRGSSDRGSRRSAADDSPQRRGESRPKPVAEELYADDEFGVGLVEESRAQLAAIEDETDEDLRDQDTAAVEEGDESTAPRKRRRRGRRGRGRRRPESAEASQDRDDADDSSDEVLPSEVLFDDGDADAEETPEKPARGESRRSPRRPPRRRDEEVDEVEESPEAEQVDEESEEREPRRRRSRRGRGRSQSDSRSESSEKAPPRRRPAESSRDDDEDEVDAVIERNKDKYRNVPTWEQAISYLVQPKRRPGDSRGPRSRGSRSGRRPPRSRD